MLFLDLIQIFALFGFVVVWCFRSTPHRTRILVGFALIAIAIGIYGLTSFRWQWSVGAVVALLFLLGLGVERLRARKKPLGRPIFSGILFTLLALPAYFALGWFSVEPLPEPDGEHPVGVRDFLLTDTSRTGVGGTAPGSPRKLMVRVWYPAETVDGLSPRPYFNDAEAVTAGLVAGKLVGFDHFAIAQALTPTNSYVDAPLIEASGKLPVIVYSHGYTSHLAQNTALMEHLASHGYIVYSVHHTGDGGDMPGPDGEILAARSDLYQTGSAGVDMEEAMAVFNGLLAGETWDERWAAEGKKRSMDMDNPESHTMISAAKWTADRIFVMDQLQEGNVPSNVADIVAAGGLDKTGQMGMSFGGSTAGDVCQKDKRCIAGINLDGGEFHYSSVNSDMRVPFMMMYSDPRRMIRSMGGTEEQAARAGDFNDFAFESHETAGLRDDIYRVRFNNVDHMTFSDFRWHLRGPLFAAVAGDVDPADALSVQNDFVRGFFDKHLKMEEVDFPAQQLQQYEGKVDLTDVSGRRTWWLSKHPEDRTEIVILETSAGSVQVALYPERAPDAVASFLAAAGEGRIGELVLHSAGSGASASDFARGTVAFFEGDVGQSSLAIFLDDTPGEQLISDSYSPFGKILTGLPLLEHALREGATVMVTESRRKNQ